MLVFVWRNTSSYKVTANHRQRFRYIKNISGNLISPTTNNLSCYVGLFIIGNIVNLEIKITSEAILGGTQSCVST